MSGYANRRPGRGFRTGFIIYILLLLVIFAAALFLLRSYLARFQQEKDEAADKAAYELTVARAPQRAFELFLEETAPEDWAERWRAANPGSFDDPARVRGEMERLFKGAGFHAWKAESFTAAAPVYLLKNGDLPLAEVTLSGGGTEWTVETVEMLLRGTEEASVVVPADCVVRCNGAVLDGSYTQGSESRFDLPAYKDALINPVTWTSYKVTGQLFPPALTVEPAAGWELRTAEDGAEMYVLSEADAKPYQDQAVRFVRTLLYYYMQGSSNTMTNMNAALNLVTWDSEAWRLIYNSYQGVIWDTPFLDATYDDVHAGEVTVWAGNCLSLDVDYHSEGTARGYRNVAEGTYRLYFLNAGNGFGIVALSYV